MAAGSIPGGKQIVVGAPRQSRQQRGMGVQHPRGMLADAQLAGPAKSQTRQIWEAFRAHRMAFIGLCTLGTLVLLCLVVPFVTVPPDQIDYHVLRATPPSATHPMGTDSLGRDVLSRLFNAGRTSLLIGFMVALFSAAVGSTVGVVAGYFGGWIDAALMWLVNVLMTIPTMPLLIAIAMVTTAPGSALGAVFRHLGDQWRIIVVFVALGWLGISRVVRSQVISLRNQEFCEAARALGANHRRVMFIHILPNTVSVIAVFTTLAVSGAIIGESALSFLGFGVQPPKATWGNMLGDARDLFTLLQYWWMVWFPALAICITVLSVNFIGDGVRDAMDPKSMKK